jgi:hypothetical protein
MSEADLAKQIKVLNTAIDALAANRDMAVDMEDGEYSLANKTSLWNYSLDQPSMGNPAIDHTKSKLVVRDGKTEIRLFFGSLQFSGQVGYLQEISKFESRYVENGILDIAKSTLTPATVHSEYVDLKDNFGPSIVDDPENSKWYPKEVSFEVIPGEEYTYVYVEVPVMGLFDAANQPARLRIDWSGFDLGVDPDPAALNAAIAQADAVNASAYTAGPTLPLLRL